MTVKVMGIDITKNTIQLHGVDDTGKAILKKRVTQGKLAFLASILSVLGELLIITKKQRSGYECPGERCRYRDLKIRPPSK